LESNLKFIAKKLKPATAHENRLPIFSASNRPKHETKTFVTPHGTVTIDGRLGQRHKDLLELIRILARDVKRTKNGKLLVFVEVYKLRKFLSINKSENNKKRVYSWETLRKLMWDIMKTTISVKIPSIDIDAAGQFITSYVPVKEEDTLFGQKIILKIEFGEIGTQLFAKDFILDYNPIPLLELEHGISKAIARYCLSHRNQPKGGWKLDVLFKTLLGENATPQAIKDAKRFLKKDTEQLVKCGIIIKNDRVFLSKPTESLPPMVE